MLLPLPFSQFPVSVLAPEFFNCKQPFRLTVGAIGLSLKKFRATFQ